MTETLTGKQVLALLAQDEPPEIEQLYINGMWHVVHVREWPVNWLLESATSFRIKPTPARRLSVTLANGEVVSWPEPVRNINQIEHGQEFFFIACYSVDSTPWCNVPMCLEYLAFGNIHLTREAAQEHADALRRINCQEVEKC